MTTARLVPRDWRPTAVMEDQCIVDTAELAALRAERDALLARVATLERALFKGHTWRQDGQEYRCARCTMRARYPMRVALTCAEWTIERARLRGRRG